MAKTNSLHVIGPLINPVSGGNTDNMPRLKLDDNGDVPYRRCGPSGNGLRSKQYIREEDPVPRSQREKDDRFDMYRNDGPKAQRVSAPIVRRTASDGPRQLWFVACLVCALGAFCIFADSITIGMMGIPVRLTSFEVILGSADSPYALPANVVYMSAMPAVFMIMFAVFAFLKEETFNKGSLALIAVSAFVIVIAIYWSIQVKEVCIGYIYEFVPGLGVIIEVMCAFALIIVTACQWCMNLAEAKKGQR